MSAPDPDALDPETFDEEKYRDYFPLLQRAYKDAFEELNGPYDSTLVHAVDQQILNESEPFYEGDGEFRIELPDDPVDRVDDVVADRARVADLLDRYVAELERQLQVTFGFGTPEGGDPDDPPSGDRAAGDAAAAETTRGDDGDGPDGKP